MPWWNIFSPTPAIDADADNSDDLMTEAYEAEDAELDPDGEDVSVRLGDLYEYADPGVYAVKAEDHSLLSGLLGL